MFEFPNLSIASVLVIGDVMLDRYLWGEVSRISPEAPVPVVRVREKSEGLGGAANVAANLAGLGCDVALIGVVGPDDAGTLLQKSLSMQGIKNHLVNDPSRPTISKTRVMGHSQQLIRLDEEKTNFLDADLALQVLQTAKELAPHFKAVILSDYGKGIFSTPELTQTLIELCHSHGMHVLVDPKGRDWQRYRGATCVTPNSAELELIAEYRVDGIENRVVRAADSVRRKYDLEWLLVTRGPKGMCLTGSSERPCFISANAREVFDVSGAGDTVIAVLAAGVASGLSFPQSAELANVAAGIVVGKLGTQPINISELRAAAGMNGNGARQGQYSKIAGLSVARMQIQAWRSADAKVVFTNGCFDLLHPGHVHLLNQAREQGDRLAVGLNTDASIRRLKGDNRPILSEQDRAAMLSALDCVDLVVLFDEDTPLELIENLRPDVLVKGDDYHISNVVGRSMVEKYGGEVRLVPILQGYSTTGIVNRMRARQDAN